MTEHLMCTRGHSGHVTCLIDSLQYSAQAVIIIPVIQIRDWGQRRWKARIYPNLNANPGLLMLVCSLWLYHIMYCVIVWTTLWLCHVMYYVIVWTILWPCHIMHCVTVSTGPAQLESWVSAHSVPLSEVVSPAPKPWGLASEVPAVPS